MCHTKIISNILYRLSRGWFSKSVVFLLLLWILSLENYTPKDIFLFRLVVHILRYTLTPYKLNTNCFPFDLSTSNLINCVLLTENVCDANLKIKSNWIVVVNVFYSLISPPSLCALGASYGLVSLFCTIFIHASHPVCTV